jgi:hypothetical protein
MGTADGPDPLSTSQGESGAHQAPLPRHVERDYSLDGVNRPPPEDRLSGQQHNICEPYPLRPPADG